MEDKVKNAIRKLIDVGTPDRISDDGYGIIFIEFNAFPSWKFTLSFDAKHDCPVLVILDPSMRSYFISATRYPELYEFSDKILDMLGWKDKNYGFVIDKFLNYAPIPKA